MCSISSIYVFHSIHNMCSISSIYVYHSIHVWMNVWSLARSLARRSGKRVGFLSRGRASGGPHNPHSLRRPAPLAHCITQTLAIDFAALKELRGGSRLTELRLLPGPLFSTNSAREFSQFLSGERNGEGGRAGAGRGGERRRGWMANSVGTITRSSVWSAQRQSTPLETAPLCRQRAASFSFSCSLPLSKSSSCTYVSMTYFFFFLSASSSYVCAWLYVQFLHVLRLHYVRNRCLNRICEEIWCKFLHMC
jgi:hypothetical protein